ncbi:polysaccharide pyruvyl transferase family protein [Euhalothece natronophila Z-M001]|uniref:Polysaccharide pyruvyl transferase family protein n=1 Tax=Euhalothece natronophila Z-M001 TaxID=522448 RepID=A0A5B8NJF4_9CHRO|nr:polysaccharide pyruvyl transferase family protein [Euhalothece natronophila]QDZ39124.1 polysaccharide pyruvyl transferase family protein [Euhalothece natronophila Z-M001]
MKLAYQNFPNFGDQLNPLIWSQLLGDHLEIITTEETRPEKIISDISLLSIGSYLSNSLLQGFTSSNKAVIAGTGCGYGMMKNQFGFGLNFPYAKSKVSFKLPIASPQEQYTDSKRFYWVRGPLSAHVLGLPNKVAVADGAYLLRKIIPTSQSVEKKGVAFMPHISSAQLSPWQNICNSIGFTYIDPRESPIEIINKINLAEVLVTDALHGAIVSDALRTPWIPVKTLECILDFKWVDHCSSIGFNYQPIDLPSLWPASAIMKTQRSLPKKIIFGARTKISNWLISKEKVAKALLYAAYSQPYLSSDKVISSIDERLETLVNQIKFDIANHSFFEVESSSPLVNKAQK